MRKFQHIGSQRGVALITVVLMTVLVVGLIALAFTNSKVESILTQAYVSNQQDRECGRGNLEVAEATFVFLAEKGDAGLQDSEKNEAEVDYDPTLMSEINEGFATVSATAPLEDDSATSVPDITILPTPTSEKGTASSTPTRDCTTRVDIDYLYPTVPSRNDQEVAGYHDSMVGTLCDDGSIFAINTVSSNNKTGMTREFRSAYYKCPD